MKTIIAGGRDYQLNSHHFGLLKSLSLLLPITEVVSGAARGVDTVAANWAKANDIPVKYFPADWKMYGKRAGHIRNADMADYARACIVFPGGEGTRSMHDIARRMGLQVIDLRDL